MGRIVFFAIALALRAPGLAAEPDATTSLNVPSATPVLYPLREVERDGVVYFFDATSDGVRIAKWQKTQYVPMDPQRMWEFHGTRVLAEGTGSNVLVFAIRPRADFPGKVAAYPGITAWYDPRGHVHTLEVLKAQAAFDYLLLRRCPGAAASAGCTLTAGRGQPLSVQYVSLTGIMEEKTLKIPLLQLELKYDELYSRLIGTTAPTPILTVWHHELDQARASLDSYAAALDNLAAQLAPPKAIPMPAYHAYGVSNGPESGGGFPAEQLPIAEFACVHAPDLGAGCRQVDRFPMYFAPTDHEPELAVAKSVNPLESTAASDPRTEAALRSLETDARIKLSKAEHDEAFVLGDQTQGGDQ